MRRLVALLLLAAPAVHAAAPYCALPAPAAIPIADQDPRPVPTLPSPAPQPSADATSQAAPGLPPALLALPFVSRVALSGATLFDFGASHGLRTIAARHGDEFMIFQATPDGQAAVSGAMTELTPQQLATLSSGTVVELGTEHGLRGLYVRSGPQFQVFYLTPDRERLIPGVLWDAAGKDLTKGQVANIPGAIPTVVVGDGGPRQATVAGAALPLMEKAHAGTVGPADAPHLWMLIDPQCIYSVRAYQALQPYVASGRLQLTVVPLSVLDYEDQGQSTRSALALLSKPADQMVAAWQAGSVAGPPSPEAAERLRANMAVSQAVNLQGTPTFFWRKPDGGEGRLDGMPSSVDALLSSLGG